MVLEIGRPLFEQIINRELRGITLQFQQVVGSHSGTASGKPSYPTIPSNRSVNHLAVIPSIHGGAKNFYYRAARGVQVT